MLALALLTFYLERAVRIDDRSPSLRRHDPDYLLSNFTTTTYNRAGHPETTLSASQMAHYPDDDTTDLTAPRLVQTKPAEPRFTVDADRGVLSSGGEEIFLYDNVVLVRDADAQRPQARVTTSFLHVLRDRSLVRTEREVHIVEERRSISGRGMEFYNESGEFVLRNDVRAHFEPDPKK
jgi:lipopolysaccharide export system protein LptC